MEKIEKIAPPTKDDLIKSQEKLINILQTKISLREQIIEKQRELIEILKKEVKRKKWWNFGNTYKYANFSSLF